MVALFPILMLNREGGGEGREKGVLLPAQSS